ncbi:MAG TPA: NAD-dependent epimerase/dehydratase family protein [Acidimicrobiales bacterium]|nr:NAD-dependent epimerase/dehydratase family protein [Acidimicrobiales bacterium]
MRTIAVTGAGTGLGRRVAAELQDDPGVSAVVSIDEADDLKQRLHGVDAVVHLSGDLRPVLDAAGDASVRVLVFLSSATVYGAWPDNPVPLSEDAPLRPNPGFEPAVTTAEAERLAAEWKDDHPGTVVCVLRPTVCVGPGADLSLSRALAGTVGFRPAEAARPVQFLHIDDLCSAVLFALRTGLDGAYNVAPDGWVPDETARALAGGTARLALPERVSRPLHAAWRALSAARPVPGVEPYTRHPWVVANDRLVAAGWKAEHTNEEAYVLTGEGSKLEISPRRRQEVALGVTAAAGVGLVAGVVALLRRKARRR